MVSSRGRWSLAVPLILLGLAVVACIPARQAADEVLVAAPVPIEGSTREQNGTPIANVIIAVLDGSGATIASAQSGTDGLWSLFVEPGTYDVAVTPAPGSVFGPQTLPGQTLALGQRLDIVLVRASTIH